MNTRSQKSLRTILEVGSILWNLYTDFIDYKLKEGRINFFP